MILEALALALAGAHFGAPLLYYACMRRRYLGRPWGVRADEGYRPRVTVIVPTYREAALIRGRLDNIYAQEYPRELVEVIVVDGASDDGTPELVEGWAAEHPDANLRLIREAERGGKARALNRALRYATGEVVVIADADALWPSGALAEAVKWFADPTVGAVSCLKRPAGPGAKWLEEGYRRYYNELRVAESKAFATPIFHGELAAFRRDLLERLGGFPTDIGADDSHTATRIALMGYRAITPEGLWAEELVPSEGYLAWRVRRAQHLVQHFARAVSMARGAPPEFRLVLYAEAYLHLVNPWLLPAALAAALAAGPPGWALVGLGLALLAYKPYRTWVAMQLCLIAAALRNLWTKEVAWRREEKAPS